MTSDCGSEIICSFGSTDCGGTQPIYCIVPYCLEVFENLSEEVNVFRYLLDIARSELTDSDNTLTIDVDLGEKPIDIPAQINPFNRTITLQETFLSYLWIYGYCVISNFDELIHKRSSGANPDHEQLVLNQKLLNYGLSLADAFSSWDTNGLPNPVNYPRRWADSIDAATSLFIWAFNFILLHEFSHSLLKHDVPFCKLP